MKIHKLIEQENIFLDLEAVDVRSALTEVVGAFAPSQGLDAAEVVEALLERESLGSTSVGDGFAIPHAKIQGLHQIALAMAKLKTGIDFGGTDGSRVSFLFVVLSPPDQPAAHLQVLSQIARVLKRSDLRANLLAAEEASEVTAAIFSTADSEGM